MLKRFGLALGAALLLLAPAFAAPPPNISYTVGVCDPSYAQRCIKPAADGSITTTNGGTPAAPSYVSPSTATSTDRGGTLTTGGAAQAAIVLNTSRKGWCIQNPSDATEVLYVRSSGTASATTGVQLAAGQQACSPALMTDTAAISVFAATTGHRWFGTEWQ